ARYRYALSQNPEFQKRVAEANGRLERQKALRRAREAPQEAKPKPTRPTPAVQETRSPAQAGRLASETERERLQHEVNERLGVSAEDAAKYGPGGTMRNAEYFR